MPNENSKMSGWEVADKVAHGTGRAVNGVVTVMTKLYGVVLGIVGVAVLVLGISHGSPGGWAGLLVLVYAIYLLLPGSKWVIW